jgi:tetratricopeptide (TPR) repeat protein
MRWFSAVPLALLLAAAAPAFADAQQHVNTARKAERRGEWRKAIDAWKAAYRAESNAEYLIGIGDAYVHLGDKDQARKNYRAYLADPLALPANVEKVKIKIAALDSQPAGLALPGGPGLSLPGLDLPPPLPAQAKEEKKDQLLGLPGLDPPASSAASKKEEKKVASASPVLELPPLPLPAKRDEKAAGTAAHKASTEGTQVAVATTPRTTPSERRAPDAAIAEAPPARPQGGGSSAARAVAWVSAGVAVAALGGGALAFTKANSAHNDLTSKVHDGATAQSLLENEKQNRSLSFVGFAGGLVAAGIATALFAF